MKPTSHDYDSIGFSTRGFQVAVFVLLIQNILLFLSSVGVLFIEKEINVGSPAGPFNLAFIASLYLDIIGFSLLAIFSLMLALKNHESSPMILIIIGSILFIAASLAWRPIMGILPENPLSSTFGAFLLSDIKPDTDQLIDLSSIRKVVRALLISNIGLTLVAIGFSMLASPERNDLKKYAILYGALNIFLTISVFFILLKALITPLIIIPLLRYMVSTDFLVSLDLPS